MLGPGRREEGNNVTHVFRRVRSAVVSHCMKIAVEATAFATLEYCCQGSSRALEVGIDTAAGFVMHLQQWKWRRPQGVLNPSAELQCFARIQ